MKIIILILKILAKLGGQDKLWEAVNKVVERKTQIRFQVRKEEEQLRAVKINTKKYKKSRKMIDEYIALHEKSFEEGVSIDKDMEVQLITQEEALVSISDHNAEVLAVVHERRRRRALKRSKRGL